MYRNVYFPGVQRSPANQQQNGYMQNPIPHREYPQFNEISPQANSAIMAYAAPILQKPYEKMSLNEALKTLQKQGKIEGRDYKVTAYEYNNTVLDIFNRFRQPIKRLHYDAGITDGVSGYEAYQYLNGRQIRESSFNNDKMFCHKISYYIDEIPQETFTKEGFRYNTTPIEYTNYLKQNNVNYKIEYEGEEDNNRSIYITEYDANNKKTQSTWWYYGERQFNQPADMVSRSLYDAEEFEDKRLEFCKDRTDICTYIEKHKSKTYPIATTPQESFTKEHITAYTKPDEYISYLEANGIKYKIVPHKYGDERETVLIHEYDGSDRKTQSTGFELSGENRVLHEIYYPDNSRKRYEFDEEITYITTFTY